MPHNNTIIIESLFGDINTIIKALEIERLPEEDQLKIVDQFSEILFKRILLRIPDDRIEEIKNVLEKGNPETFLHTLEQVIPDIDTCIEEEMLKTVDDFKQI